MHIGLDLLYILYRPTGLAVLKISLYLPTVCNIALGDVETSLDALVAYFF